jgi:hypothetical protein
MAAATHVIPYALDEDPLEHYEEDARALLEVLRSSCDGLLLEVFQPEIHNPYPMGITLQLFLHMKRVMRVLHTALTAIVKSYLSDPRLHAGLLQVSDEAHALLKTVDHLPYNIGSWRPDFLFPKDKHDTFSICEINARFPFNAFYASHEKNAGLSELPYLREVPAMPIAELDAVPTIFKSVFDSSKSLGLLKASEAGWDVRLFRNDFNHDAAEHAQEHPHRGADGAFATAAAFSSGECSVYEDGG